MSKKCRRVRLATTSGWRAAQSAIRLVADSVALRAPGFSQPGSRFERSCRVAYPLCALRYGFMRHAIESEVATRGPLRLAEIGVDRGQLLHFMEGDAYERRRRGIAAWHAYDIAPQTELLQEAGYEAIKRVDIETEIPQDAAPYDLVVACHVLEHLRDPLAGLQHMVAMLRPGGCLVGGFPVSTGVSAYFRERRLRRNTRGNGHVSVFSPGRLQRMAATCGLRVEWMTGAFLMRSSGFWLERHRWWGQLNAGWGWLLPSLGNELYFTLRRPAGPDQ